jgi:glycosyltransferase involved in cell wall biosynthesis
VRQVTAQNKICVVMKASVLLITYNQEKYIGKAIESVLMQQYKEPFEIIVCDDASSDKTAAIAQSLLQTVANAKVFINDTNLGITQNYKKAFSLCQGEYIFPLEGDDYWIDSQKLQKQSNLLDSRVDCMSCSHFYYTVNEDSEVLMRPALQKDEVVSYFNAEDIILDPFIGNNYSTCCYRRSSLQRISPDTFNVISYEWMINISVSQFGKTAVINQPMSVYRISPSGFWNRLTQEQRLRGMIDILPKYDAILQYRYHSLFERKKSLLQQQLVTLQQHKNVLEVKSSLLGAVKRFLIFILGRK